MKLDLKELLAKITGQTEFKTLLWTNPSPGSSFSAQTILSAADIQGYDAFEIEVKNYYTGNIRNICKINNVDPGWLWCFDTSALGTATGYRAITNRRVTLDANGLSVSTGYNKTSNSNAAGSTGTTLCIPLKVYGIKYVGGVVRRLLSLLTLERGWAV